MAEVPEVTWADKIPRWEEQNKRWLDDVEAYQQLRAEFIKHTFGPLQSEMDHAIKDAGEGPKAAGDVAIMRTCGIEGYALYRDLFFALRDSYLAEGKMATTEIIDNHYFENDHTVQPTEFQFVLKVEL